MFTGLVESTAPVSKVLRGKKHAVLHLRLPDRIRLKAGDSLAVDGVCLTVVSISGKDAIFHCVNETLKRTTLGKLCKGDRVNLETPLALGDFLGGHWVQGHIDGVGTILSAKKAGKSIEMRVKAPRTLCKFFVSKGSVSVDGVSLTIANTHPNGFSVSLIPETLARTTLGRKKKGAGVNLEVDLIAKLVERFTRPR